MKNVWKKILAFNLSLFIFTSLSFNTIPVQAGLLENVEEGGLSTIGTVAYEQVGAPQKDVQSVVASIIYILLTFLGIIFLVLIIWSGFEWMTAGGDQAKVTTAKSRLSNGVIGLVVVLASWGIALYIMKLAVGITQNTPTT